MHMQLCFLRVLLFCLAFTVHIPRPLFSFSTLSLPVVVALKADHMTKETLDAGSYRAGLLQL